MTAPDLSGFHSSNMLNLLLDNLIGRGPSYKVDSYTRGGMWTNLVRLTDKGLLRYESARSLLLEYVNHEDKGQFSLVFRSIDGFEDAISATARACRMASALAAEGVGDPKLLPEDGVVTALRAFRNRIEHADEDLTNQRLREGQNYMLVPGETGLQIGENLLDYSLLAESITSHWRFIQDVRR